ncbi:ribosome modulation factor [Paraglaciecola sp. 25GB23A]|jgi:ribosome modulation factor|uniref:ribosome modulation factor n=1 Tax=Paraglaciecola sp. 25GB23A TaxID=3156068 RepID=UPI0032AF2460|tara:strand:+ start:4851 stop:5027 length:177 start_codon:yes stop_codon:yes gene_type:complete
MKRQKRDKLSRAHSKGYQAGIVGRSKELCPFQASVARSEWLGGWREAIGDRSVGLINR